MNKSFERIQRYNQMKAEEKSQMNNMRRTNFKEQQKELKHNKYNWKKYLDDRMNKAEKNYKRHKRLEKQEIMIKKEQRKLREKDKLQIHLRKIKQDNYKLMKYL